MTEKIFISSERLEEIQWNFQKTADLWWHYQPKKCRTYDDITSYKMSDLWWYYQPQNVGLMMILPATKCRTYDDITSHKNVALMTILPATKCRTYDDITSHTKCRTYDNITSHKKAALHPISRRYTFEKTTGGSNGPTVF